MKKSSFLLLFFIPLAIALLVGCAGSRKRITSTGVHAIKLGEAMPALGIEHIGVHNVRDTFVDEGEYHWREIVMEYKKGKVYLEEDFFGSEHLSRIRVYTPELSLRNGLRVGMTVADASAKANDWVLVPLPKYRLIELYSRTMPRIHLLVHDPKIPMDRNWEDYKIDQLDPNAPIKIIVVF